MYGIFVGEVGEESELEKSAKVTNEGTCMGYQGAGIILKTMQSL